jgi:hypothetical protein
MRLISCVMISLFLLAGMSVTMAAEKKKPSEAEMKAVMETYAKLATPGEPHKGLATLVGSWETKTKAWMKPDQAPMESKGSCEQKMILGGRFLQSECTGDMMGSKYTGIGVTGHDNHTKKYQATWMDSMGTAIYFLEGPGGADTKIITMEGMMDDPMEGPMKVRSVTRILNNNTHLFEMYGTGKSGKETKMMEMTYTRKK